MGQRLCQPDGQRPILRVEELELLLGAASEASHGLPWVECTCYTTPPVSGPRRPADVRLPIQTTSRYVSALDARNNVVPDAALRSFASWPTTILFSSELIP